MLVKLCPLCDSEMKKAHYCDACHSFVWKPIEMDIHYNTNVRGLGEIDCSYSEDHDSHKKDKKKKTRSAGTGKAAGQTERRMPEAKPYSMPEKDKSVNRKNKTKKRSNPLLSIIIIIIMIISASGSLFAKLEKRVEEHFDGDSPFSIIEDILEDDDKPVPDIQFKDEGDYDPEPPDDQVGEGEYYTMDNGELEEYPDGCNTVDHFDLTYEEAEEAVDAWLGDRYAMTADDIDALKEEYESNEYSITDDDKLVFLNTDLYYQFNELDDSMGDFPYIDINSDSATRQIHYIASSDLSEEDTKSFFISIYSALCPEKTEDEIEKVFKEVSEGPGEEEYSSYIDDGIETSLTRYDDGLYLYIRKAN